MNAFTILLVEDSAADARLVQECFPGAGDDVSIARATDVDEALAMVKDSAYDLVLLDLNLPVKSGFEFLRWVRDSDLRGLPVVVLSGSSAPADILRAYEHHANAYIVKPASLAELQDTLTVTRTFWLETAQHPPLRPEA